MYKQAGTVLAYSTYYSRLTVSISLDHGSLFAAKKDNKNKKESFTNNAQLKEK